MAHPIAVPLAGSRGVVVARGWAVRVWTRAGQLVVSDGIGPDATELVVPRIGRLRRLVIVSRRGYIALDAVHWLHEVGATLVHLDHHGDVLGTLGRTPVFDDARLRRAQAVMSGEDRLVHARNIMARKIEGQAGTLETLAQKSHTHTPLLAPDRERAAEAAGRLRTFAAEASAATSIDRVTWLESAAAGEYWRAWAPARLRWARTTVPAHWTTVGPRHSPLTSGARVAVTPAMAALNLWYTILAAEVRIACHALSLDPGIGVVHRDTRWHDGLVYDLIEPCRPVVDKELVRLVIGHVFAAAEVRELVTGAVRFSSAFGRQLLERVTPAARKAAGEVVEDYAAALGASLGITTPTPLTGRRRAASRPATVSKGPDRRKRWAEARSLGSLPQPSPSTLPFRHGARPREL